MESLTLSCKDSLTRSLNKWLLGAALVAVTPLAAAISVSGTQVADITDYEVYVGARGDSTVNVYEGADIGFASFSGGATLNMLGGDIGLLRVRGDSSAAISGGSITTLRASGNSTLLLSNIDSLEKLYLMNSAQIELIATGVEFDGSYLQGYWDNGNAFSFATTNWTGVITNGLPGFMSVSQPAAIPLPRSAWLFSSAVIGVGLVGRSRKLGMHQVS